MAEMSERELAMVKEQAFARGKQEGIYEANRVAENEAGKRRRRRKSRLLAASSALYILAAIWTGVHADAVGKDKLTNGPTFALVAAGTWPVYWTALGFSRLHARLFEQAGAGSLASPSAKPFFCLGANGKAVEC